MELFPGNYRSIPAEIMYKGAKNELYAISPKLGWEL